MCNFARTNAQLVKMQKINSSVQCIVALQDQERDDGLRSQQCMANKVREDALTLT